MTTMREEILELIKARPHTSFVELSREIPGFKGELGMGRLDKNIVYWTSLSEEASVAIEGLLADKLIEMNPASILTYIIDGAHLKLPLVKSARKYKELHWLPVTFSLTKSQRRPRK
jgi:hypothetical protein